MAARRFMVGGNWKMNGNRESLKALMEGLKEVAVPDGTGE